MSMVTLLGLCSRGEIANFIEWKDQQCTGTLACAWVKDSVLVASVQRGHGGPQAISAIQDISRWPCQPWGKVAVVS